MLHSNRYISVSSFPIPFLHVYNLTYFLPERMTRYNALLLILAAGIAWAIAATSIQAQDLYRPQVALSNDGSYALAWEEYRQLEFTENWQIAVQRFSATGQPLGNVIYFDPPSCSTTDVWLNDNMQHVEMAYNDAGQLIVVMEHYGAFTFIFSERFTSEITLGVIDRDGTVLDLNNTQACSQFKFIYPGDTDMARPRFAISPSGPLFMVSDGNFQDVSFRNSALAVLNTDLSSAFERPQIIHQDLFSESGFHMWPDVATNGRLLAAIWHRCPFINNQGDVNECDVDIQFSTIQSANSLTLIGQNRRVNAGDPQGTINFRPAIDMAEDGRSVVVWVDNRTGAQFDVFGQRFDAAGQPAGSNFQISQSTGFIDIRNGIRPEVAMLDNGRFMVVWGDSSAAGFSAWQRFYDSNGTPLTAPQRIANNVSANTGQPAIASNGSALLTAYRTEGSTSTELVVRAPAVSQVSNEREHPEPASKLEISSFPQPFDGQVTIRYALQNAEHTRIDVFNPLGQQVALLVDAYQREGSHQIVWTADALPPGPYLLRIRSGDQQTTHTLMRH